MKIKVFITLSVAIISLSITGAAQDSLNMKKLSIWTSNYATEYNDCWGYTDSLGNECAILGSDWGTHFIDVTDPSNPVEVDSYGGWNSNVIWRDFKVFGKYVVGVADNYGNSLQIFDMSDFPNSVSLVYDDNFYSESAHNIYIEGDRAYLASNRRNDTVYALDIISLEDPLNPFLLNTMDDSYFGGCWGITHDIYVKNDTAYCSSGDCGLYIYDLTDPFNPQLINAITTYTGQGYNHSSWVHEDGDILVMADEVPNSLPLKSFDISNLSNPVELTTFMSDPAGPRPHNPFFVKNELAVSYYLDGLQIFDFTDPSNPIVSAFYDTYPDNDTSVSNPFPNVFDGAWGTYPFFESRNIVVADITYGMFMVTKEKDVYTTQDLIEICDNPDSILQINFHVKGDFDIGNEFYLELADSTKSFISAQVIDTVSANLEGDYSFTFDPSKHSGSHFRLRVRSTMPAINESSWLTIRYNNSPTKPNINNANGTLSIATSAQTIQWYYNNSPINGANNSAYIATSEGNYYVEVANSTCSISSDVLKYVIGGDSITRINPLSDAYVNVYPNPSSGFIYIVNSSDDTMHVEILDAKGSHLKELNLSKGLTKCRLAKGVHFLKISSNMGVTMKKVVVL